MKYDLSALQKLQIPISQSPFTDKVIKDMASDLAQTPLTKVSFLISGEGAWTYQAGDEHGHTFVVKVLRRSNPFFATMGPQLNYKNIGAVTPEYKVSQVTLAGKECTVCIYPFIAGTQLRRDTLDAKQRHQAGVILKSLHLVKVERQPKKSVLVPFRQQLNRIKALRESIILPQSDNHLKLDARDLLLLKADYIDNLIGGLENNYVAYENHAEGDAEFVVCHGDFHPYNLVVNEKALAVLDWDMMTIGPREMDLARWMRGNTDNDFMEGYGIETNIDQDLMQLYNNSEILNEFYDYTERIDNDLFGDNDKVSALKALDSLLKTQ